MLFRFYRTAITNSDLLFWRKQTRGYIESGTVSSRDSDIASFVYWMPKNYRSKESNQCISGLLKADTVTGRKAA